MQVTRIMNQIPISYNSTGPKQRVDDWSMTDKGGFWIVKKTARKTTRKNQKTLRMSADGTGSGAKHL